MSLNWCVQICFCFWSTIFALLHCFALFSRTTKNKKQKKRKKVIPMEQALDQGFQYPLCIFTDWSARSLCWLGYWLWMTEWYRYEAGSDLTRSQSSFGLLLIRREARSHSEHPLRFLRSRFSRAVPLLYSLPHPSNKASDSRIQMETLDTSQDSDTNLKNASLKWIA